MSFTDKITILTLISAASAISFLIIEVLIITVLNHLLPIPTHMDFFIQYFMLRQSCRETIPNHIFVLWNINSTQIEWNCNNHILQIAISYKLSLWLTKITVYLELNCNFPNDNFAKNFSAFFQNLCSPESFLPVLTSRNDGIKSLPRRHYCYR